jgi:hypothetical protein
MDDEHEAVALGGGRRVTRGDAMGGSSEWGLKLAPMVFSLGAWPYKVYGAWDSHLRHWRATVGGEKACAAAGLLP